MHKGALQEAVEDVGVNVMASARCKNMCDRLKYIKTRRDYNISKFCCACDWWLVTEDVRCSCCDQILRTRSRNQNYERRKEIKKGFINCNGYQTN